MCLLALAIDQSHRFPLVVASNRDEFFARPSARLGWWTPDSGGHAVLGGRDLASRGTWLGLTAQGRLAMVTNLRNGRPPDPEAPSRGKIVTDWLSAGESTGDFWMRTSLSGYNGFNLIAADFSQGECFWASNLQALPRRLERGIFGLSNGELDSPWPKVEALMSGMRASLDTQAPVDEFATQLFALLSDRTIASDARLPQTGITLERERQLSPAFIRTPDQTYGTRSSTLVITERLGRQAVTHVFERSFDPSGAVVSLRRSSLRNWPSCYADGGAHAVVQQEAITESEMSMTLQAPGEAPSCLREPSARSIGLTLAD
jgi:uncharacterized protein with NRDE domain